MRKNESLNRIMATSPVTIGLHEPVSKVRRIFDERNIHHLPVVDGQRLVGIISSSDLLRASFGTFSGQDDRGLDAMLDHTYTISDLMHPDPVTIGSGQTVREAAEILVSSGFHSLPVVDDGCLTGIVTSTDLIQYLLDQY